MSEISISVTDNGPLKVTGGAKLLDGTGQAYETKDTIFLCRCGLSSKKPFCNGAHKGKLQSEVRV